MKVLIVSKTRMQQNHVCVGGLVLRTGQSLRLLEFGRQNPQADTPYSIGDVWNIEHLKCKDIELPHSEDTIVTKRAFVSKNENILSLLKGKISVWEGGPESLFDEALNSTQNGKGFVSKGKVPKQSTGFWISDQPLHKAIINEKINYSYPNELGIKALPFVGFQKAVAVIPAGTLLRVSLARWWKPENADEERCYLQLSGWYRDQ